MHIHLWLAPTNDKFSIPLHIAANTFVCMVMLNSELWKIQSYGHSVIPGCPEEAVP